MSFDVLLAAPEALEPAALGAALAKARGIPVVDASHQARSCWGILAEGLEESEARGFAQALEAAGVPSWAVPQASVAELPPRHAVAKLELAADSLRLPVGPGTPELVAARQIRLIEVACFHQEAERPPAASPPAPDMAKKMLETGILLTTGLPIKLGGRPKKEAAQQRRAESELMLYLDLYITDPPLCLRIDAQNFDYSFLKARMLYNVLGNFKLMVADLAAAAPRALRGRGTRVLLSGAPLREMGYQSLADAEREARWLLTIG